MDKIAVFWFRRDLRLEDNAGLYYALKSNLPVLPLFIFDSEILEKLEDKKDARVEFIHNTLMDLQEKLSLLKTSLLVKHGTPIRVWGDIIKEYKVGKVFANHDYEPYAISRDEKISKLLQENGIEYSTYKDQVIFEKSEIIKDNQEPFTIYTPYSKKWKTKLNDFFTKPYPTEKYFKKFISIQPINIPTLKAIGFEKTGHLFPKANLNQEVINYYDERRNFPAIVDGVSKISVHLRFGTLSIRKVVREAINKNETYLNELIWREFFMSVLFHFPNTEHQCFKVKYENIHWRNNEEEFDRWCKGNTGYPIVDAGIRELNATGYMHNRVRLITASFLCKHLLIDWRWGEAYFAKKLLDYDMSANVGNWQWAAGCGCDAAPYFRIFNPYLQTLKFDKDLTYIKKWVPEFQELSYPKPLVDHDFARKRALEVYAKGLGSFSFK